MRRIVFLAVALVMLAATCFAYDGGRLNKYQDAAEKIMDIYDGEPVPEYRELKGFFNPGIAKSLPEEKYSAYIKQVKDRFGAMKEVRFVAFQVFDQVERISYLARFTKEESVLIDFAFGKDGKLTRFTLAPFKETQGNRKEGE